MRGPSRNGSGLRAGFLASHKGQVDPRGVASGTGGNFTGGFQTTKHIASIY